MGATLAASPSTLDTQGPVAEAIAGLWWLMLALGVAVFVVFAVLLGVGLARRRGDGSAAEEHRLVRRFVVVGGVAVPAVIILVVLVATLQAMRATPTAAADGLVIEIVGHQWWYEVRYPDAGVVVTDELHLPVGEPVTFEVRSEDVIHSFWIPALGGKIDLLPEHANTLVLQADEPGEHVTHCAEFCGLDHAHMRMEVTAEPREAFERWLAEQGGASAASGEEGP